MRPSRSNMSTRVDAEAHQSRGSWRRVATVEFCARQSMPCRASALQHDSIAWAPGTVERAAQIWRRHVSLFQAAMSKEWAPLAYRLEQKKTRGGGKRPFFPRFFPLGHNPADETLADEGHSRYFPCTRWFKQGKSSISMRSLDLEPYKRGWPVCFWEKAILVFKAPNKSFLPLFWAIFSKLWGEIMGFRSLIGVQFLSTVLFLWVRFFEHYFSIRW